MEGVKTGNHPGDITAAEDGPSERGGDEERQEGRRALRGRATRRGTRAANGSGRRQRLVRLAAEIFARKGFQATTVREIAKEAGILSGSLYHHFDSKESIVDEVLSTFLEDLLARYRAVIAAGGEPREVIAAMVRIGFEALVPHRAAITVMQNDWNYLRSLPGDRFGYLVAAEEEVERMWVGQIKRGQAAGQFRADVDPKLTYRMIRDTIWVTVRWFRPDGPLGTGALADNFIAILFDGLTAGHRAAPAAAATGSGG
jgi:AcrR family transcriptional regulator|nr:MAG: TetR family transcriptional regulator [Actinomycetota bacterium]